MEFIIGIVICIVVPIVARYIFLKPSMIAYKLSFVEWVMPNTLTLLVVLLVMVMEIDCFANLNPTITGGMHWIWIELIKNGILIIAIIWGVKKLYGKMVELQGLDKLAIYNETTRKIFITMVSIMGCFFVGIVVFPYWGTEEQIFVEPYVSRIVAWIINIVGIWLDFGTTKREKRSIVSKVKDVMKNFKKYLPIYAGFCLVLIIPYGWILIYLFNESVGKSIIYLTLLAIVLAFATYVILDKVYVPRDKRSSKKLKKNITQIFTGEKCFIKDYYKEIKYLLLKDKEEIILIVVGEKIVWNGFRELELESSDDVFENLVKRYSLENGENRLLEETTRYLNEISDKRTEIFFHAQEKAKRKWEEENLVG